MAGPRSSNNTWSRWRRLRQLVQILFFAFFIYLLFAALQRRLALPLADLFFRLDPLTAVAAMLASRVWIARLGLALLTLGLTVALGRVWCGWICPLGSLLEWIRFPRAGKRVSRLSTRWRAVKYFILFLILAAALFGNLTLLVFDPLTLLTRTMTTAVLPAVNYGFNSLMLVLYPIPFLQPPLNGVENLLRGSVLPVQQPVFDHNGIIALLMVLVIGLNALADRFWCRYLCPLGALLGLVSKIALLRPVVGNACNNCEQCAKTCRLGAVDATQGHQIVTSECTVCLDCLAACPQRAIGFSPVFAPAIVGESWANKQAKWPAPAHDFDPNRRQALLALATGAAGVAVLRTGSHSRRPHPYLIRPPGVEDEDEFLARCLRCSQCMKVCPTSGLQPTGLEAGLEGFWTPQLVPRLGYCNYSCNACGQICPSQAIPCLDLDQKRQAIQGVAVIDRNRCLPWAEGTPCIVCEEMCPKPDKAIRVEEKTVKDAQGRQVTVQKPYVLPELCIGCGICEFQCPVAGEAAIRVRHV